MTLEQMIREGSRVKAAREAAKVTQSDAAAMIGTTRRTLQNWEDGVRVPKVGYDYLVECMNAIGNLASEGRQQILEGHWDMNDAIGIYKQSRTQELSEWGRYGATYEANRRRIPESVWDKLPAEDLAKLVDAIKAAYDDGYVKGQKGEVT